ncbi:hypothetical protein ACFLWS_02930 [Chloroflexota bacterium]
MCSYHPEVISTQLDEVIHEGIGFRGTRFVGLRLVRYLASQEHDITILNRGETQVQLPPEIKQFYADRRDPEALRSALNGQEFETIFDITGYDLGNLM